MNNKSNNDNLKAEIIYLVWKLNNKIFYLKDDEIYNRWNTELNKLIKDIIFEWGI